MALIHEFTTAKQADIQKILENVNLLRDASVVSPVVGIHDDFILYFADSMKWIETTNPRKKPKEHIPHQSLCYYGLTLFLPNQVTQFKRVIEAWYSMFSLAPDEFIITGSWTEVVGEENSGKYDKIQVIKAEILKTLSELIQLCVDVEKDDSLCLFHWGI